MNALSGKNITVIGSEPSLGDTVDLISLTLGADENNITVTGVETHQLVPQNVGDVVVSPGSLLGGKTVGLEQITAHVRTVVGSQIPVVVLAPVSASQEPSPDHVDWALQIRGVRELPGAIRRVLNLPE